MIEVSVVAILIVLVVTGGIAYVIQRHKQLIAIRAHQERLDREAREFYQSGNNLK